MKKAICFITLLITSIILLSSCTSTPTILEEKIKTFDFYTEIVDFSADHGENIKLLVAYDNDSTEVTYIYYVENVRSDLEIIFKYEDEIIYEDFIVYAYDKGEDFIGEFKGSELSLDDDITKIHMGLIHAGTSPLSDFTYTAYIYQEFNVIKSTDDFDALNREAVATSSYTDAHVEIIDFSVEQSKIRTSFFMIVIIGILLYIGVLQLYKKKYTAEIQKVIKDENKKSKMLDLQQFKYISGFAVIILVIIANICSTIIIQNYYSRDGYYYETYETNFEEIVSESINLKYGGTAKTDSNVAFVEKELTHYPMGYLYIEFDDGMIAVVPKASYGGYNYKVTYRYILSEYIDISVKKFDEDEETMPLYNEFSRILYFDWLRYI